MEKVSNFDELAEAVRSRAQEIVVTRGITALYSLVLPEGTNLRGEQQEDGAFPMVSFVSGDGLGISADNNISDIVISTAADNKAIFSAFSKADIGAFAFKNITLTGQLSFILRSGTKRASVTIEGLDIIAADARKYPEQPQKYGVNVLQGALTVYNFNSDADSELSLTATNITIGRKNAPVGGTGIFIAGFGDEGGKVTVKKLHTGAVYSTGRLPFGVADFITGGVFLLNGAHAYEIIHDGEIVTYGVNDMALDAWGTVDNWAVNAPVTSYGPSGIGFVNFGVVRKFVANAPFTTYGQGARGYNQYDGTVDEIRFKSIKTYGNGSVAIQISKPIGTLTVEEDVSTHGSVGTSLVKGVNVELPAYALSIKEGGTVEKISIGGNLETFGDNVTTYTVSNGAIVKDMTVSGKTTAHGQNSQSVSVEEGGQTPNI